MNDLTQQPKRRIPKWAFVGGGVLLAVLLLSRCGGSGTIDMDKATCDSLIPHVIEMSQDRSTKILEITRPHTRSRTSDEIVCDAPAESSNGEYTITYRAHVSNGGSVMLEYDQP